MIRIAGDLHGAASNAKFLLSQWEDATENDMIILAGDFGAEYGGRVMGSFKKAFKKFPGTIIVMRGNHDDCYWKTHAANEPDENWIIENNLLYQKKYPNIKYVKDEGGLYTFEDKTFLFIPGAYSVDKYYRLQNNYPYNPDEQLTYVEKLNILDLVDNNKNIDYIISHTSPLFLQPYYKDLFLDVVDQSKVDVSTEAFLDQVYDALDKDNLKKWYFGHYHDDRVIAGKFHMVYTTLRELGE